MSAASRWSSLQCIVFFRFSLGELIVTDCNVSMSPVQRYSCSVNCVTTPRPRFGRSTTHASSQSHHFNVYKMQLVLNLGFRDHVTPALQQLHWLPVEHSINTTYKLCAVHWCTRSLKLSGIHCLIPPTSGSFIIWNKHHTIHHFLSLPFQT